jgi:hypothetical protein
MKATVNFFLIINLKFTCTCLMSYYTRAIYEINEINLNSVQSKPNQGYILVFIFLILTLY